MAEVTERRTALCRGCEAELVESRERPPGAATWTDGDGRAACIPAVYAGHTTVPHMPMPDGFRGAPQ